jgi:LytS/YehU family sensor histidine kinase
LIRAILENSKHQLIPVWKDMETLKLYLELETLGFDHKFNYQLDIAEELQQGDYKIPPLLIQPYVENAIHHGLMNKINDNRNLLIKAAPQNGEIKFTIEDNGIGRQQSEKIKELNKGQHLSLGQLITENRIKLYNNGMNESVKITDLVNSKNEAAGTRVEITLENK